jgi:hypothetical protein
MTKPRKYTFRKGQDLPYESGSYIHQGVKELREASKGLDFGFELQGKGRKGKHPLEF